MERCDIDLSPGTVIWPFNAGDRPKRLGAAGLFDADIIFPAIHKMGNESGEQSECAFDSAAKLWQGAARFMGSVKAFYSVSTYTNPLINEYIVHMVADIHSAGT